ncbi:hypothetical protein PRIPAC_90059 [Pristionchus pacificus]|nr:hypothetical protein PRIPAC_90059 [Pristionchus pacificus]
MAQKEISHEQTTFLSLPNEIICDIITFLEQNDRKRIRNVDKRLRSLERSTGYRNFDYIEFNSDVRQGKIRAIADMDIRNFKQPTPELAKFFSHASTAGIAIKGRIDEMFEAWMESVLRKLRLDILHVEIEDEKSCRILQDLIRSHREIKEVHIEWNCEGNESNKQMFFDLPPKETYIITSFSATSIQKAQSWFDDEILCHLIGICCSSLEVELRNAGITATGMTNAFDMLQKEHYQKKIVRFSVSLESFCDFMLPQYDNPMFIIYSGIVKHRNSGATLRYTCSPSKECFIEISSCTNFVTRK